MRLLRPAATTVLAAALFSAAAHASGRYDRCEPEVENELARLQVDPDRVGGVSLQVRRYNSRQGDTRVQGVLGWVDLRDCAGRLVVDMSPRCRVKQSYTTGACSVTGVPAY